LALSKEVSDFVAAFSGMKKAFGDKDDKEYKRMRNQLMQFRLQQAQHEMGIRAQLQQQQQAQSQAKQQADAQEKAALAEHMKTLGQQSKASKSPMDPKGGATTAGDTGNSAVTQENSTSIFGKRNSAIPMPVDDMLGAPNLNTEQPTSVDSSSLGVASDPNSDLAQSDSSGSDSEYQWAGGDGGLDSNWA
jgi:hypothetical protein